MHGRCFSKLEVPHRSQLFIGNEWRDAEGGRTFLVENPATDGELFHCARASEADVDAAVRSSRECFRGPSWGKQSSGKERAQMMRKMGAVLGEQREEWAILESMDNGKPINEARSDIDVSKACFDYYADYAEAFDEEKDKKLEVKSDPDMGVRLVQEPAGVVGMVTPWNFPLMQAAVKVAPALAAGCSMILKPSSVCPATCLRLGELAQAAGLPAGALNIVTGTGSEAGAALIDHRFIDRLSFTGSSAIGHTVLHAAASRLVPSTVELGGKGAIVVFDDVDIEAAVDWIMIGVFMCSGQTCSATSRLVVQKGIEGKLLKRLAEETTKLRMGDPLLEDTQIGSLTSKTQLKDVAGFVDRARQEGAEVIAGGVAPGGPGCFYPATILRTPLGTEAWKEEIFGPVLAVQSFDTEEEAVRLANDTEYGLGSAVICKDAERCERVALQLNAGIVWKNNSNSIPMEAPFGGFGKSGFGKEYGAMGFEEYTQTKVITSCEPGFSWNWYVSKK